MTPSKTVPKKAAASKQKVREVRAAQKSNIVINLDMPVCTQEEYGTRLGLTPGAVRGHVERKLVPTLKIGKHRFINVAKLTQQCLEAGSDE